MDEQRLKEMMAATQELKRLNRDIWQFMPRLQQHLAQVRPAAASIPPSPPPQD
jgi:hypothetical protein